jgi:hypothetical protein
MLRGLSERSPTSSNLLLSSTGLVGKHEYDHDDRKSKNPVEPRTTEQRDQPEHGQKCPMARTRASLRVDGKDAEQEQGNR